MNTIDTDDVSLVDLTKTAKRYYPTLKLKRKKGRYQLKVGRLFDVYSWELDTRVEIICVLSGLISGYEIINKK
jgi:hypothetical protein